ncbi:MAG: glycerophosphodiester phosphodiesterase family protein [Oscillospiraceae bacterium]
MGPTILLIVLCSICVVAYIYFYMNRPMSVKKNQLDFLLYQPIAHRGLHSLENKAPENSLKAFSLACEANYPIEIDIHLTSDERVIVFHDDDLKRMTGENGKIEEKSLEFIKTLNLANTDEKIPTLEETLNLVVGRVPLLIEFKGIGKAGKLEEKAYEILKRYNGRYAIQSFDFRKVTWFKKHAPHIMRGQLAMNTKNEKNFSFLIKFVTTNMLTNFISRPHFASYRYTDVNKYGYKSFSKKGITFLWTVYDNQTATSLLNNKKIKCNNIIFQDFIPDLNK